MKKNTYQNPEVEILELAVEQGFSTSGGDGEDNLGGEGSDTSGDHNFGGRS